MSNLVGGVFLKITPLFKLLIIAFCWSCFCARFTPWLRIRSVLRSPIPLAARAKVARASRPCHG